MKIQSPPQNLTIDGVDGLLDGAQPVNKKSSTQDVRVQCPDDDTLPDDDSEYVLVRHTTMDKLMEMQSNTNQYIETILNELLVMERKNLRFTMRLRDLARNQQVISSEHYELKNCQSTINEKLFKLSGDYDSLTNLIVFPEQRADLVGDERKQLTAATSEINAIKNQIASMSESLRDTKLKIEFRKRQMDDLTETCYTQKCSIDTQLGSLRNTYENMLKIQKTIIDHCVDKPSGFESNEES